MRPRKVQERAGIQTDEVGGIVQENEQRSQSERKRIRRT